MLPIRKISFYGKWWHSRVPCKYSHYDMWLISSNSCNQLIWHHRGLEMTQNICCKQIREHVNKNRWCNETKRKRGATITHRQNSLASLATLSNLQALTIKINHFMLQGIAHKSDLECHKCKQRWVICLLKHQRAYKCNRRLEYIRGTPRPIIIYWLHRDEHLALT